MRKQVFISYSHKDRQWLEQLQEHLKPLEREGKVTRWDDTRIASGQKWKEEIERALASTKVAVLLVSSAFLASDFIADNELPPLLEAAERDGAVILSVLVGPSRYRQTASLSGFQAVNDPSKTLIEMAEGERARVWVKLTEDIEAALAAEAPKNQIERNGASVGGSSRTLGGSPEHRAEAREADLEANVLEETEIKNTRAGDITGIESDGGAGSDLKARAGVLNKSKIEGSVLGNVSGVTLKGVEKKSE